MQLIRANAFPRVDNNIIAGGGYNTIDAAGGDDQVLGGNAGNKIYGGGGDDTLVGGLGNDWLDGGDDINLLTGGAGTDTFHVSAGSGITTVTDYTPGVDKIDLRDVTGLGFMDWNWLQTHAEQQGNDVVLHVGTQDLVLGNTTLANMQSSDILLNHAPTAYNPYRTNSWNVANGYPVAEFYMSAIDTDSDPVTGQFDKLTFHLVSATGSGFSFKEPSFPSNDMAVLEWTNPVGYDANGYQYAKSALVSYFVSDQHDANSEIYTMSIYPPS